VYLINYGYPWARIVLNPHSYPFNIDNWNIHLFCLHISIKLSAPCPWQILSVDIHLYEFFCHLYLTVLHVELKVWFILVSSSTIWSTVCNNSKISNRVNIIVLKVFFKLINYGATHCIELKEISTYKLWLYWTERIHL
jgi:hypothetical protein